MGTKLSWIQNGETQIGHMREEEWQDTFCMKKVKTLRMKQDGSFVLDKMIYCAKWLD